VHDVQLVAMDASDHDVVQRMLYEAAFWRDGTPRPPFQEAMTSAELRPYHGGWGRTGDHGVLARIGARTGDPVVGAAWSRLFTDADHGYGFVDAQTPEVTLAVAAAHRRLGIGRALLSSLMVRAGSKGFSALSLSVEHDNPARSLYEDLGFETVAYVGNARTMVVDLAAARPTGPPVEG
jgi:ribosomal protein S18 acetylase RimI-like enzyme